MAELIRCTITFALLASIGVLIIIKIMLFT